MNMQKNTGIRGYANDQNLVGHQLGKGRVPQLFLVLLACGLHLTSAAETFTEVRDDGITVTVDLSRSGDWNGTYTETKDQQVVVKGQYRSGKKSGKWQWYRPDGEVWQRQDFKDDLLHGTAQRFHPNNKRSVEGKYHNGVLTGPLLIYDQAGKPQRVVHIPRTEHAISDIIERDWPRQVLNPGFTTPPSSEAPLVAGEIDAATLDQALQHARCFRVLSGADVEGLRLDADKNRQAQHATMLLSLLGKLSHTPTRPANVPDDFFKIAFDGCNRSNLSQGSKTLPGSIMSYMDDSDASNITRVGHRRWILEPKLGSVGFGHYRGFSAMHVTQGAVTKIPDWQIIAFPGEGVYPSEIMLSHMAWSVLLNATHFPRNGSPSVSVHSLDEDYQIIKDIPTKIIAVDAKDQSGAYQIIFKPEVTSAGRYWIRLTGVTAPKDRPLDCGYMVYLQSFQHVFSSK